MKKKKENDIFKHIKIIQNAIDKKNNLTIFVGAGVSANSGVPTWSGLIKMFTDELGIKDYSSIDYLKIAQIYYNEHPRKYMVKIKELLDQEWEHNPITKFLFTDFDPKYFITTNYDCILEKTMQNLNNIDYKVITKNEDIPNIKDKAIIKMHGDFQNKNIVLKEEDYNKYSEKFKLIETFIKSIFATSVVIFVGFSADDPNVNQIYHWVKDILKDNQKPTYLINVNKIDKKGNRKEKILKKYLEKKGIYQFNYSQIQDLIKDFLFKKPLNKEQSDELKKLKNRGQHLYELLYFIKNYHNFAMKSLNDIILLEHFNYVSDDLIGAVLFNDSFTRDIAKTLTSYSKNAKEIIEKIKVSNNSKEVIKIQEYLASYGYKKLCYQSENEKLEIDIPIKNERKNFSELFSLLDEFNYIEAQQIIEQETIINEKTIKNVNIFAKAYTLTKLNRYWEAYNELLKISKYSENKHHLIFVLSEYNRREIGFILTHRFSLRYKLKNSLGEDKFGHLENDVEKINIKYLINNYLSNTEQTLLKNKLDGTILSEYKDKIMKNMDYVAKNTNFLPGIKLFHQELYRNFTLNYVFVDNDNSFKNLYYSSIKLMLQDSQNIINRNNEKETINSEISIFGKSKETEFNNIDLYIMVEYIKPSDLESLFEITELKKIKLTEQEKNKKSTKAIFINSYSNLIDSIIKLNLVPELTHMENKFFNYIYNFFIIFAKINLTQKEFKIIIKKYMELLQIYEIYPKNRDIFKYLIDFIIEEYNDIDKRKNIDIEILEELLIKVFNKTKNYENNLYSYNLGIDRLVRNLSNIIMSMDKEYKITDKKVLKNNNSELLENSYVYLYAILSTPLQKEISLKVKNKLKSEFSVLLYHTACLNQIIKPNKDFEDNFYNVVKKRISEYKKRKELYDKNGGIVPTSEKENAELGLNMASNLINFEKITSKNQFKMLKNDMKLVANNYFNFVLDMKNFDYNNFDIEFMQYLTEKKIEQLKEIVNSNKKTKQILKKKFYEIINIKKVSSDNIKKRLFYILYNEVI